jgi:hypothetical protein
LLVRSRELGIDTFSVVLPSLGTIWCRFRVRTKFRYHADIRNVVECFFRCPLLFSALAKKSALNEGIALLLLKRRKSVENNSLISWKLPSERSQVHFGLGQGWEENVLISCGAVHW